MEFFIFHFKLHLISWPSLELCDSFLPFSPEASVSGQGKQGMTPSGAHQCCSASSSSQAGGRGWFEAGAIQHQESPSSICESCCLLHLLLWLQHGCCRTWGTQGRGKIQGSTACAKAALKAEAGDCRQSHLQMAGSSVQGCCPSMSFSKCKTAFSKMSSERNVYRF